jgi:parvulin-like peptidyl-prolyl isomerase
VSSKTLYWAGSVVAAAVTLPLLLHALGSSGALQEVPTASCTVRGDTVARVGNHVLYDTDLALVRAGEGAVDQWVQDQLLAESALDLGLENPAVSAFVAQRAVQVYLRDLMVENIMERIPYPTEREAIQSMEGEPALYLIERHYYQMILADSAMADSILTRLSWGQNFQVTARNVSIGQKAGIGGDLGFVTGAEMLAQGLPLEVALLDGLSSVVHSSLGWHIFKVEETRALQDSARAVQCASEVLYETRIRTSLDSVLTAAEQRLSVEVDL